MVTSETAERMCKRLVESYINTCKPKDLDDVELLIMKLLGMAGLALSATHGKDRAVATIEGIAIGVGENAHRSRAEIVRSH